MFPFVEGSLVKAICSKFSKLIQLNECLAAVPVIETVTHRRLHFTPRPHQSYLLRDKQGFLITNPFMKVMADIKE